MNHSERFDKAMGNLLDIVYDLGTKLAGVNPEDLTKEENALLEALDEFSEAIEELE